MINVMKPRMPRANDVLPYLQQIDDTGVYSNFGPLSSALISRLASYFGVTEDCIVLMSNATLALQGSLSVLSSNGAGKNVVMPSWTFTASASAAVLAGLNVEFADIDEEWRVNTKLDDEFVLDVLPFGEGLRDQSTNRLAEKWQVIDGAASFDALQGAAINISEKSILVVSMHATKLLGAGEGGICITGSAEVAKELKAWSNFGFNGSRDSKSIGTNSKLSEYSAAVALASLDLWSETKKILGDGMKKAIAVSKACNLPTISSMSKNYISPYWIVNFDSRLHRDGALERLRLNEIETRTWWGSGCHTMSAYRDIRCRDLQNTEWAAATSLGLPFHSYLTDSDYEIIQKVLKS
jgi:dTDP-4-amino-4,6-dideoxygalactose transaminase